MVSAGTLAYLRRIQAIFLTDTAEISRYTETSTSDGVVQDWQPIAAAVPCRVSRPARAAIERAGESGALRAASDWVVWLPFATDVTERDRITVTGTDRLDGRTFEVESVGNKTNETGRACGCVLVI
jgi:head-tail adaptor